MSIFHNWHRKELQNQKKTDDERSSAKQTHVGSLVPCATETSMHVIRSSVPETSISKLFKGTYAWAVTCNLLHWCLCGDRHRNVTCDFCCTAFEVSQVDFFISHSWSGPASLKVLAICHHLNLDWAIASSIFATLFGNCIFYFGFYRGESSYDSRESLETASMWLTLFPITVFIVTYLFGHFIRKKTFWFDRISVNQVNLLVCPASPALMNALMVVWVRVVQRQEPRASLSVYLDDRTIWKRGANGIQIVVNAMRAGAEVDTVLGFELHPDKLASFTTRSNLLPQLALHQSTVGEASNKFTLLGIQYNLERAGECVNDEPISRIIAQRCRRIRVAARHLGTRKALLLQLVIPLFAWTGAFHHYHGNVLKQWTMTIEAAIWGRKPPPGRSRFLFWNSLGVPSLHPGFVLLFVAAKAEWNRQCRLAIGLPAASISCNRWQAVLKAWKWHVDNIGIWNTSAGKLKPGWMSSAALKKAAVAAWIRQMWEQDTKTEGALPPHKVPVLQFQQHVATELNFYGRRVLTGAAVDGRVVQRIGHPMQCECGEEMPTREHFTFFCSANPWHLCLKTGVERRLLLSLIDAPPVIPFEDMVADPQLVAFLQQFDHSQLPTLGSDGSCIIATGSEQWQRASWAVAAHLGPAVNGLVPGFEQTPAAGERFALLQALLAASAANRPVKLLTDNQAVCLRLERGLNYGNWSGDLPCFWHLVSTLVIAGTSCVWIPSHGKQPLWRPPAGWLDVQLCRQLNARADAAASDISAQFRPGIEAYLVQQAEARRWSSGVFQAQLGRSQRFWQVLLAHDPRQEQGGEED